MAVQSQMMKKRNQFTFSKFRHTGLKRRCEGGVSLADVIIDLCE